MDSQTWCRYWGCSHYWYKQWEGICSEGPRMGSYAWGKESEAVWVAEMRRHAAQTWGISCTVSICMAVCSPIAVRLQNHFWMLAQLAWSLLCSMVLSRCFGEASGTSAMATHAGLLIRFDQCLVPRPMLGSVVLAHGTWVSVAFRAAWKLAEIWLLLKMCLHVLCSITCIVETLIAAFCRANVWLFASVCPVVKFHVFDPGEATWAVCKWAAIGPFASVAAQMYYQFVACIKHFPPALAVVPEAHWLCEVVVLINVLSKQTWRRELQTTLCISCQPAANRQLLCLILSCRAGGGKLIITSNVAWWRHWRSFVTAATRLFTVRTLQCRREGEVKFLTMPTHVDCSDHPLYIECRWPHTCGRGPPQVFT